MCMAILLSSVLGSSSTLSVSLFFFNDTATTEIYTLSLHDALPIRSARRTHIPSSVDGGRCFQEWWPMPSRSEEHTSELQSRVDLVCRLLLEKKKEKICILFSLNIKKKNVTK